MCMCESLPSLKTVRVACMPANQFPSFHYSYTHHQTLLDKFKANPLLLTRDGQYAHSLER